VKEHRDEHLNIEAKAAYENLAKFPIPAMQDEEWRFLDLTSLTGHEFSPSCNELLTASNLEQLKKLFLAQTIRIVLINGRFAADLSDLTNLDKNLHTSFSPIDTPNCSTDSKDDIQEQNFFTCLNQSFFTEELCLNVVGELAKPIHLLQVSVAETKPVVSYPRTKIVVNSNCKATLIEDYVSFDNEVVFTNFVTTIELKVDGKFEHTVLQRLGKSAFSIGHMQVRVEQNATYDANVITQGARLSRNDIDVELNGVYAQVNLNGLTGISERQISDTKSVIKHNFPDCHSNQLHKSIVDQASHSIFNGKILVANSAARTEAHQQNRSLMLSTKARVTTEPKLEINNDDVVCTHGATVSQMDKDILFFLKSRGIDQTQATKLCVNAFLHDIINKVPLIELQNILLHKGLN
jgi:Fe-S cluster assembly protein SufD